MREHDANDTIADRDRRGGAHEDLSRALLEVRTRYRLSDLDTLFCLASLTRGWTETALLNERLRSCEDPHA